MADSHPELIQHIAMLDAVIAGVADADLKETVALLKIARLDFVMRVHGVTEDELAFTLGAVQTVLAHKQANHGGAKIRNRKARVVDHY